MANWTTTDGVNSTVEAGVEVTLDSTSILITAAGGYSITPENFVIGGATETSPGSNIWEGGNVDNIVSSVEFTQDDVYVRATVTCEDDVVFNADSDIFIDIDENPTNPVTNDVFGVCTRIKYPYVDSSKGTAVLNIFDGTSSDIQVGDASNDHIKKVWRYENDMSNHLLAQLTVTPASGFHITGGYINVEPAVGLENSLEVNYTHSSTSSEFYIRYTQTEASQSLNACDLLNMVNIGYTVAADSVSTTNTVHGVSTNATLSARGGSTEIKVLGDADTQYDVTVRNGTTNDYYNWDGTYGASSASATGTIGSNGTRVHRLHIPASNSAVDYNIILSSVGGSTLASGVPISVGDMQIKQYGMKTLTVRAKTEVPGNFGTISPSSLSIKRPTRYSGDSYTKNEIKTAIIKGKTDGSSTRVKLTSLDPNLKAGMRVMGDNIPHGTVIKKVDSNLMVLSNAVDLSAVQNIQCKTEATDTVPFSFTIPPNSTPNTLSVNTSNVHRKSIWGFNNVTTEVDSNQIGTTALVVTDSRGILDGMSVTGDNIPTSTTVSSVDYSTHEVTLNQAHTGVVDRARVFFKGANNPSVSVAHIDAEMSGSNVIISGYLIVPKVDNSAKVEVFLDDIITVT